MIDPLERLTPPCQANRTERRLGRARHYLGHDVIDREKRIEGGAKLDRPVEPDKIAIPNFNDR